MAKATISINFYDEESESNAFASIRKIDNKIALSLSVEKNGDIDTLMTKEKAKELANALLGVLNE